MESLVVRRPGVGCIAWLGVFISRRRAKDAKGKAGNLRKTPAPEYAFDCDRNGGLTREKKLSAAQVDVIKRVVRENVSLPPLASGLSNLNNVVGKGIAEHELPRAGDVAANEESADVKCDAKLCLSLRIIGHASANLHEHLQNGVVIRFRAHTPNENKMSDGGLERAPLGVEVWK